MGSICWALKKLWRTDRWFVFYIFSGVPFTVLLPLLTSYFTKVLLDCLGSGVAFKEYAVMVVAFLTGIAGMEILKHVIDGRKSARHYYPTVVYQAEMSAHMNDGMDFENTETQKFQEIAQYAYGDACTGNCSLEFIWRDISNFLISLVGVGAYGSLLGILHPVLFIVIWVTAIVAYVTSRWQPSYYEGHKQEFEKEKRKIEYFKGLSLDFSLAKDIKLYGLEQWLDRMLRDYQSYVLLWEKKLSLRGVFAAVLAGIMSLLQNGTAYLVLIGSLFAGDITVGDFVFYFGMVSGLAMHLQSIIGNMARLSTRAEQIAHYRDFFDFPNRLNYSEGCELPKGPVKIEFKDVHYRYDGAEKDTLNGINLTIQEGESIALVGMNGAGKTTLVKLLCGFLQPTQGEILVNGKHITEYNIKEYYSLISAVFQNIVPLAFTMFEYVTSADPARPTAREDAKLAMQKAGIWEKIEGLEHGTDTHLKKGVFEDSVDLSGGEMQKLVLARAIYKDSSILILDEPTAALDPVAENKLYLQYRELTKGKTSVYISHRFASTRFCDRIILLEDGMVTETGTHEELLEKNGQYAYMFGVQAKYYKEEVEYA